MPRQLKYTLIYDRIKAGLESDKPPKDRLPSLLALSRTHKASLMTVRRAVKRLEQEGYVTCHADSRGTVINPMRPGRWPALLQDADHPFTAASFAAHESVTVRYLNPEYHPATKAMWDGVMSDFHEHYSWIEVKILPPAVQGEQPVPPPAEADLVQLPACDLEDFQGRGWIGDWTDLASKDRTFANTGWMDLARVGSLTPSGVFAGMPQSLNIPLSFYCPALVRRWVPEKTLRQFSGGWSWASFQETANRLAAHGVAASVNLGLMTYWSSCLGRSVRFMDPRADLGPLGRSIQRLNELRQHVRHPERLKFGYQQRDMPAQFLRGHVGLFNGYSFYLPLLLNAKASFDILPLPLDSGGFPRANVTTNAVGAGSGHKTEAWLLAKFIASEKAQRRIAGAGGLPILTRLLHGREPIWPEPLETRRSMIRNILTKARPVRCSTWLQFTVYHRIALPILHDYFNGRLPLMDACRRLQQRGGELMSLFGAETE